MNYDPRQLNPPEPSPDDTVTCECCQDDICREDAHNVGDETFPVWICSQGCLVEYATNITAEYATFRRRSAKLMAQVTHGAGPDGHHDFGRWDIFPTDNLPAGCLAITSKPNTGQYRVIQIGGEE